MRSFDLAERPSVWAFFLLCLLGIGTVASARHAPRRVEVKIEDLKFKPVTIEISTGDTIVWINDDDTDHDIKADDGSFDSGRLAAGHRFEHKIDKSGKFDYHDDLHPRMHGTIVVTEQ